MVWCAGEDLHLHGITPTTPSKWRVCCFATRAYYSTASRQKTVAGDDPGDFCRRKKLRSLASRPPAHIVVPPRRDGNPMSPTMRDDMGYP